MTLARQSSLFGNLIELAPDTPDFDEAPDLQPVPAGRYGTILADPPWGYEATSEDPRLRGFTDRHYKPLTTADLCALPVAELADDRSVLLLWKGPQVGIPVGQLRAFRVLAATGHTVLVIRGRIDSEFLEWLRFSPTGKPSGFEATTRTEIGAWLKAWADWADRQESA